MIRHPERYEQWAEVVKQQEASGLSVAAYCRQEGIKRWKFFGWRRRVRDRDQSTGEFVPMSFREESDSVGSGIAVVVGRVRLELSAGFDGLSALVEEAFPGELLSGAFKAGNDLMHVDLLQTNPLGWPIQ